MTLDRLGRPLRDLRISVTDRCNFRCVYCMPKSVFGAEYRFLDRKELLTFEEIERVARAAVALGVEKLRLTGGEPLVRKDVDRLIAMLAPLGAELTLTTNASLLASKAQALAAAGLDRVTVSLDSLDDETFRLMNDVDFSVSKVLDGIDAAAAAGLPVKVNAVVKRGLNDDGIVAMARYFRERGHTLRFIEYMDVGATNGWRLDDVVPAAELIERISAELPLEPAEANYRGEVAQRWRYADGSGEIGVIASVTQPFCGDCTRARISAEGRLYTCLFGLRGHDLRATIRARRLRRGAAGRARRDLGQAHRPLLGAALRGDGEPAQGRDELHRRLTSSTLRGEVPTRDRGTIRRSMAASTATVARRLPRGWAHLALQFGFWIAFYFAYQLARGVADREGEATAFANGAWVIDFQRSLGAMIELTLQRVVESSTLLIQATSLTYWLSQFAVVGIALTWVYFNAHDRFYGFRNMLIVGNLIGLLGYVLLPTAPPRMFPEAGFTDTLAAHSTVNHSSTFVAFASNPYAAMPSLHALDATIVSVVMATVVRRRWAKVLWLAWAPWVWFAVMATGNHFWLDVAAGVLVAGLAAAIVYRPWRYLRTTPA